MQLMLDAEADTVDKVNLEMTESDGDEASIDGHVANNNVASSGTSHTAKSPSADSSCQRKLTNEVSVHRNCLLIYIKPTILKCILLILISILGN